MPSIIREIMHVKAGEVDQVCLHLGVEKMQQECIRGCCFFQNGVGINPNEFLKTKRGSKKVLKLDLGNYYFFSADFPVCEL